MPDLLNWMATAQDGMVLAAEWLVELFRKGAETFLNWMTNIMPLILILLTATNSLIALVGEERINKPAAKAGRDMISRYLILPWVGAFFLTSPAASILGRSLPEAYKPGYYASVAQTVHTNNGLFPYDNLGELFVWVGIVQGIVTLQLLIGDLAIRYLPLGAVLNFFGGWATDFTTAYVTKQQGVTLSKEVHAYV